MTPEQFTAKADEAVVWISTVAAAITMVATAFAAKLWPIALAIYAWYHQPGGLEAKLGEVRERLDRQRRDIEANKVAINTHSTIIDKVVAAPAIQPNPTP